MIMEDEKLWATINGLIIDVRGIKERLVRLEIGRGGNECKHMLIEQIPLNSRVWNTVDAQGPHEVYTAVHKCLDCNKDVQFNKVIR